MHWRDIDAGMPGRLRLEREPPHDTVLAAVRRWYEVQDAALRKAWIEGVKAEPAVVCTRAGTPHTCGNLSSAETGAWRSVALGGIRTAARLLKVDEIGVHEQ